MTERKLTEMEQLKDKLRKSLKDVGAFEVGIAAPDSFDEYGIADRHPLRFWDQCKSVVVFIFAKNKLSRYSDLKLLSGFEEGAPRYTGVTPIRLFLGHITHTALIRLNEAGYHGREAPWIQRKLAARNAGLGVYGRCGFILNPQLGPWLAIGSILTDAVLEPDTPLQGFNPCERCSHCVDNCPAEAFTPGEKYPESMDRDKCAGFYFGEMRCSQCWQNCPTGKASEANVLDASELCGSTEERTPAVRSPA